VEHVDTYLPLPLITSCVDSDLTLLETSEPGVEYHGGVDFAKQRDETVLILLEQEKIGSEPVYLVRHISAWVCIEYQEQLERIRNPSKTFKMNRTAADQTGAGKAVIEGLRGVIPHVQVISFTPESKAELASALRMLLEQKKLRLPNDRKLIMQLNGLRTRSARPATSYSTRLRRFACMKITCGRSRSHATQLRRLRNRLRASSS
jgi:phage FluMu gp28-like protein